MGYVGLLLTWCLRHRRVARAHAVTNSPHPHHSMQGENLLDYWYMTDPEYWAKVRPGGKLGKMPGHVEETKKKRPPPKAVIICPCPPPRSLTG